MNYIKQIEIENFMTHKHTVMELVKGINVITGDTASGKSNIIRALIWLFYNTPLGDQFIRCGEKETMVKVILDDDHVVVRGKDRGSKNYYKLITPNGQETEFNNFGHEFPKEIKDVLKMSEVRITDKSNPIFLNLCAQLEQPFFINDDTINASERAKWISMLMNIEEIDSLVDDFNSDAFKIQRYELKTEKENLQTKKKELLFFDNLAKKERKLQKAQNLLLSIEQQMSKLDKLNFLNSEVENYKSKLIIYRQKLASVKSITKYTDRVNALALQYEQFMYLYLLRKNYLNLIQQIKIIKKKLQELESIKKYNTIQTEEYISQIKIMMQLQTQWDAVNHKLKMNDTQIKNIQIQINEYIQKYIEVLKEIGKCPICLTDIGEDVMSHIEEELGMRRSEK